VRRLREELDDMKRRLDAGADTTHSG
jgi:hypothetical protein